MTLSEVDPIFTAISGAAAAAKMSMWGYIAAACAATYIVRNTRGVTGFVGSGTDPIPLTDSEIRKMGFDIQSFNINYEVNDQIRVITGPFENFTGTVISINKEKHKVKVMISMFGRETPVDVDFTEVEKIAD